MDKQSVLERDTTQSLEGGTSGLQLIKKPVLCLSQTMLQVQTYWDKRTSKQHTQFMWHIVISTPDYVYQLINVR